MRTVLCLTGIVLAIGGIAVSAYLKWNNVDMTPLRLFLTYPVLCVASTFAVVIGGAMLKASATD